MTTTSNEGTSLANGQRNVYRTITGCAPSSSCPLCQGGSKRFRDTHRDGDVKTVEYKHVGVLPDPASGKPRPALVLCQDQTFALDLTGRF